MAFNCPYTSPSLANIPVSSARQPVDLVTYRHEDELVYVTPALNYEQAVDFAKSAYPRCLGSTPSEQICFEVGVIVQGTPSKVKIAPNAWGTVVSALERFEIIEVVVKQPLSLKTEHPPPKYPGDTKPHPGEPNSQRSVSPLQPRTGRVEASGLRTALCPLRGLCDLVGRFTGPSKHASSSSAPQGPYI